jgi:hypothetical protein
LLRHFKNFFSIVTAFEVTWLSGNDLIGVVKMCCYLTELFKIQDAEMIIYGLRRCVVTFRRDLKFKMAALISNWLRDLSFLIQN